MEQLELQQVHQEEAQQQEYQIGKQPQQLLQMEKHQQGNQQLLLVYKNVTIKTRDIANVEALHRDLQPMSSS